MSATANADVSAIVVTFHTGGPLWDCLAALREQVDDVVVVDNGSDAATLARLKSDAHIRLITGHGNVGFAAACNRGAAAGRGAVLLFINPDAELAPGAVAALRAAQAGAAKPCVVGGALRDADGREQRGGRRGALTWRSAFATFSGLSRFEQLTPALAGIDRRRDPMPLAPTPMPVVSGALMLIARDDFAALGGFDEGYFLHVEDIDLCRRAHEAGGSVMFTPHAGARHVGASSDAPATIVAAHKARGFHRYFRKFARSPPERVAADAAGAALGVMLPLGALLARRR